MLLRYNTCTWCGGPMVLRPGFFPYCRTWEYMDGGCLPEPKLHPKIKPKPYVTREEMKEFYD